MYDRMKPYALTVFLFGMVAYLGVQALTGERGLLSGGERDALLSLRQQQLDDLDAERQDLEARAKLLRPESLSRDLLEERARAVLGFSDPRDYAVRVSTQTQPQGVNRPS